MLNERVYTKYGRGTVVALFDDGTCCVRLDTGSGIILFRGEIECLPKQTFRTIEVFPAENWSVYSGVA
jgi:hypothetical protein